VLKNGQLILDWGEGTNGPRMLPAGEGKFLIAAEGDVPASPPIRVSCEPRESAGMRMRFEPSGPLGAFLADRYDPTPPASLEELAPSALRRHGRQNSAQTVSEGNGGNGEKEV
jgi:hypothetical protein